MYENRKMRPVETIPGIEGREIMEKEVNLRTSVNVTMYPQYKNNKI
jgi:hypothetical protein